MGNVITTTTNTPVLISTLNKKDIIKKECKPYLEVPAVPLPDSVPSVSSEVTHILTSGLSFF